MIRVHLATVVFATSYITLGVADPQAAHDYWAYYAVVTLVLAVIGIFDGWRNRR